MLLYQHLSARLWPGLLAIALLLTLWAGYLFTTTPINLVVNGQSRSIRTRYLNVAAILRDLELTLQPEDIIQPAPQTSLSPGSTLTIQLARPVTVEADGHAWRLLTHARSIAETLAQIGLVLHPRDEVFINGTRVAPDSALPNPQPPLLDDPVQRLFAATRLSEAITSGRPEAVHLTVRRAMAITLYDGSTRTTFYTAQLTIGQALSEQGLTIFSADNVTPPLDAPLSPGLNIYIERSTPVTIIADGYVLQTRTRQKTVGEMLAQEGFSLMGQDFSRPSLDQPISANATIELIRVREIVEVAEEYIPFETEWVADETLELDQQQIRQPGITGVIKTRDRVRYENGHEVWREVEDEWLDQTPSNRVVAYGTKVTARTLDTPAGPIEYWRKISMLTTAYNAASSGKALDHPRYGYTRTGLRAGYGVVAVDPKVIPLMTNLYIPGYGAAIAGDTGGSILGKHIDLGYDDDIPLPTIYEWRDVYILTPIPSADQIRYVLPQWPQR